MLKRGLKLLNERLRRIGDGPRSEMVLLFVSLVCLIGSLVVLTGWVLGRALPRSFNFERAWISPLSEFEHQVELFRKNKLQADFAEPLQRMKHVLIHQLTPLAGDLETQAGRSKLADAVVRKAGGRLGLADVTGILESLTKLERLERELLTYRFVSHEEFDRIFKRCRPLLELFEENDNHTRTR